MTYPDRCAPSVVLLIGCAALGLLLASRPARGARPWINSAAQPIWGPAASVPSDRPVPRYPPYASRDR